jgi:hypothetical protein
MLPLYAARIEDLGPGDFESRARSELQLLDRIAAASMTDKDRCEASFMLIDDTLPRDIDRFVADKESAR